MIKNIIFDLGGVLLKLDRIACVEAFTNIGFKNFGEILNEYVQEGFFLDFERGAFDADVFRFKIREHINGKVSDKDIDMAMKSFLIEIPKERLDYILELRKQYRVFLLSNTNPIALNIVKPYFEIGNCNIDSFFERIFLSFEMKLVKPDIKIFEAVISELSIKPEETLFIDDGLNNLEQASKLGIKTLMINQESDFAKEINEVIC